MKKIVIKLIQKLIIIKIEISQKVIMILKIQIKTKKRIKIVIKIVVKVVIEIVVLKMIKIKIIIIILYYLKVINMKEKQKIKNPMEKVNIFLQMVKLEKGTLKMGYLWKEN